MPTAAASTAPPHPLRTRAAAGLRVAQVNPVRTPRGMAGEEVLERWTALPACARAAAEAGFDTIVVQAAWRDEEIERDRVRYRFVAERGVPARLAARVHPRLARAVRRLRPDVVHLQGMGSARPELFRSPGAAVVVQDHAGAPRTGWRGAVQRWALRGVDGAIFTAREQAEPFLARGVLRAGTPVFEVPESTSRFTPGDVEQARRATGIGGAPCLLWLGHLDANKDPLAVLDAVARVRERLPGIRLWMCYGAAPLEAAVRARLAAEPELASRVALLGRVPHARVEALCRAADFFVQGSRRESTGFALLESLACGATPLVTGIPAFRRLTRGGAVGGLFAPGDADALARLILRFAAGDAGELRAAARAHFERHLSPAALSRELAAAYRAVAGARR